MVMCRPAGSDANGKVGVVRVPKHEQAVSPRAERTRGAVVLFRLSRLRSYWTSIYANAESCDGA